MKRYSVWSGSTEIIIEARSETHARFLFASLCGAEADSVYPLGS